MGKKKKKGGQAKGDAGKVPPAASEAPPEAAKVESQPEAVSRAEVPPKPTEPKKMEPPRPQVEKPLAVSVQEEKAPQPTRPSAQERAQKPVQVPAAEPEPLDVYQRGGAIPKSGTVPRDGAKLADQPGRGAGRGRGRGRGTGRGQQEPQTYVGPTAADFPSLKAATAETRPGPVLPPPAAAQAPSFPTKQQTSAPPRAPQKQQPPAPQPTALQKQQPPAPQPTAPQKQQPPALQPSAPQKQQPPALQPSAPHKQQPPAPQPSAPQKQQPPAPQPTAPQKQQPPAPQPTAPQKQQPPALQKQQPPALQPSVRPKQQPPAPQPSAPQRQQPLPPQPSTSQKQQPPARQPSSPEKKPSRQTLELGSLKKELPPTTGKQYEPIPRPDDGGTKGRRIALRANFFRINVDPNITIYHYDVDVKPEIRNKAKMREVVKAFTTANPGILSGQYYVFDGKKNMYTYCRLPIEGKKDYTVKLPGDGPRATPLRVFIQLANTISLYEFVEFIKGRVRDFPKESIQALDIVFREMPNSRYIPLNQYFFTQPTGERMGTGLELWSGFSQSVRPGWKVTMLNIDSSVRVFHKGQKVLSLLEEVLRRPVDASSSLQPPEKEEFDSHIRGLSIEIDTAQYTMLTRRSYKIIGLSQLPCNQQNFPMSQPDGSERPCIVSDYFKTQYNLTLRYPKLPCLQAQPREKHRYLPMELCIVKKGQQLKKLNEEMTAQLIRYSAIPAPDREKQINQIMRDVNFAADPIIKSFGLSINPRMVEIEGRVLEAPKIEYKADTTVSVRDGSWNMRNVRFFSSAVVKMMTVICFDNRTSDESLGRFINSLCDAAGSVGMQLPEPIEYQYGRNATDVSRIMQAFKKKYGSDLELIIAVLPVKSSEIYGEIKRVGDLDIGVATQCVQAKNVFKANIQTAVNICQKINAKLGETNAIINQPQFSQVMRTPVIIMGADVTHPAPGDDTKPSIAAVTGSYDGKAFKYAARISMQQHRQEIIVDLKNITVALLNNFRAKTTKAPQKIIFYRDGVSEGQFREVLASELQAIQQACYELSPNYKPLITFIVVQKRHHTRLFCKDRRDENGRSRNVPAGTTVDTDIVHPIEFDFYLCSHQGIQGTSKPAHYYVLYDDSNFSSDVIQELTYQLCHVYARCTRSVSIPAPAYYAHHCAFRGRYYYDRFQRDQRIPEGDEAGVEFLRAINHDCLLNENYKGMFFA